MQPLVTVQPATAAAFDVALKAAMADILVGFVPVSDAEGTHMARLIVGWVTGRTMAVLHEREAWLCGEPQGT